MRASISAVVAATAGIAASAAAAPAAITVADGAVWSHEQSGVSVPAEVAGYKRTSIARYDADGYNVAATLQQTASDTEATLYLFRSGKPDVAIWADRARTLILTSDRLGTLDTAAAVEGSFVPPGAGAVPSGYEFVTPLNGKGMTSTGLILLAVDGWLVKLRMTSSSIDAAALRQAMHAVVGGLTLPRAQTPPVAYASITDCADRVAFAKQAKLMKLDMMGSIMLGTTLRMANEKSAKAPAEPQVWCRDEANRAYTMYRAAGDRKSYLLAFNDAGLTAHTGAFDMGSLMSPGRGYLVTYSDGVTEEVLPPFTIMPAPAVIAGALGAVSPITSRDVRPGAAGNNLTIKVDAPK
jgi:hypothetical protein